jgi:hypothetical protein
MLKNHKFLSVPGILAVGFIVLSGFLLETGAPQKHFRNFVSEYESYAERAAEKKALGNGRTLFVFVSEKKLNDYKFMHETTGRIHALTISNSDSGRYSQSLSTVRVTAQREICDHLVGRDNSLCYRALTEYIQDKARNPDKIIYASSQVAPY